MPNWGGGGDIRNRILVCFHRFYSDKMITLKYVFIVFFINKLPFFGVYSLFIH